MHISPVDKFDKNLSAPPDKSETVRAYIAGAVAEGATVVENPLIAEDTESALHCIRALGADVGRVNDTVVIRSRPIRGEFSLNAGNSATTLRLLTGLLSGIEGVKATIAGDKSLCQRDMSATIEPLRLMGASIEADNNRPPLYITGRKLQNSDYKMPSASAQVKSAILFAALTSGVKARITEPIATRRHTERLMKAMGGEISCIGNTIIFEPSVLTGRKITIGGDLSSAAYPMAAAFLTGGRVTVKGLGYSEERSGFLRVFSRMGAEITRKTTGTDTFGEIEDVSICGKVDRSFIVEADEVPSLIDEIPLLSVAACFAKGRSIIKGASALKNKETNRIATTLQMIKSLGGCAYADSEDSIIIEGAGSLMGGKVCSFGDHRIAMSAVVGLLASERGGETDTDCISVSYPKFTEELL